MDLLQQKFHLNILHPQFENMIKVTTEKIQSALDSKLHSLYLYGSVATGRAKTGQSDLDVLLVLQEEPTEPTNKQIRDIKTELSDAFVKQVREVGIARTYLAEIEEGSESLGLHVFLKHLCLCLSGKDLRKDIGKFKPTKRVAAALNGDAPEVLERLWRKYEDAKSQNEKSRIRASIARKILRTGLCFAMAQKEVWATERNAMAQLFLSCYPEHRQHIDIALQATDEFLPVTTDQLQSIKEFSQWVAHEAKRVF